MGKKELEVDDLIKVLEIDDFIFYMQTKYPRHYKDYLYRKSKNCKDCVNLWASNFLIMRKRKKVVFDELMEEINKYLQK